MSRGRCLRDTDVSAADAGDLPDDVAKPPGPPPPPPVRTPPTAPTPVSREEAEREREHNTTRVFVRSCEREREIRKNQKCLSFFSFLPERDFDGWMKWMDGWIKR